MNTISVKQAALKAARSLWRSFPMILATILLVSLVNAVVPKSFYVKIFRKNALFDSFIGSSIGSISAGTPITSYILGGELLKQGISLIAVTAFLVSWVTVGIVQFPAESAILGKKFAFWRNLLSFILSIFTAVITVAILNLL